MRLLIILLLLGINSCDKDKTHQFQLVNKTSYKLNSVTFDWYREDNKITLEPFEESEIYSLTCEENEIFGPCLFDVAVLSYSDSTSNYENTSGMVYARGGLHKNSVNRFIVEVDTSSLNGSNIFKITIER